MNETIKERTTSLQESFSMLDEIWAPSYDRKNWKGRFLTEMHYRNKLHFYDAKWIYKLQGVLQFFSLRLKHMLRKFSFKLKLEDSEPIRFSFMDIGPWANPLGYFLLGLGFTRDEPLIASMFVLLAFIVQTTGAIRFDEDIFQAYKAQKNFISTHWRGKSESKKLIPVEITEKLVKSLMWYWSMKLSQFGSMFVLFGIWHN